MDFPDRLFRFWWDFTPFLEVPPPKASSEEAAKSPTEPKSPGFKRNDDNFVLG